MCPDNRSRFERWQHTYNHDRPDESLDQQTPADFYRPSARRLGENDKPLVFPKDQEVEIIWRTQTAAGRLAPVIEKSLALR